MQGKFRHGGRLGRWRDDICGALENPQDHGVAVGDEEIAHAVRTRAGREELKTAAEQRMPGVCDFDFSQVVYRWVVDRGIKVFDRSTKSIKQRSWKRYTPAHTSPDLSRSGSRRAW